MLVAVAAAVAIGVIAALALRSPDKTGNPSTAAVAGPAPKVAPAAVPPPPAPPPPVAAPAPAAEVPVVDTAAKTPPGKIGRTRRRRGDSAEGESESEGKAGKSDPLRRKILVPDDATPAELKNPFGN